MHYLSLSFTYKTMNLEDREKLCFESREEKIDFLKKIHALQALKEAILINTCNRIEVYACVEDFRAIHLLLEEFAKKAQMDFLTFAKKAQIFQDREALLHIFSVAGGIDSLVIGDAQIIAQLKNDFALAKENFPLPNLEKVMHEAYKAYAKIKNETGIFKNQLSLSSIAVKKAKSEMGTLKDKKVLVVGSGTMGKIACQYLLREEADLTLINRTKEKAENLAETLQGKLKVGNFSDLKSLVNNFELFFFATSCNDFLVKEEDLQEVNFKRFFFDLALPRDIDIKNSELNRIFYIDDLQEIAKENEEARRASIEEARIIIEQSLEKFLQEKQASYLAPTIKLLRLRAQEVIEKELAKAKKKGYIKKSDEEEVYKILQQSFNAFLHLPTVRLRESSSTMQEAWIENLDYIFDLNKEMR